MNPKDTRPKSLSSFVLPVALSVVVGLIVAITISKLVGSSSQAKPSAELQSSLPTVVPSSDRQRARRTSTPPRVLNAEATEKLLAERHAEMERREMAQYRSFENYYVSEQLDAAWSGAKEAKMLEASVSEQIKVADAIPKNLDIDCKSSTCKITSDFKSRTHAEDWVILFSTAMGSEMPNLSYLYSLNPDGTTHVVAYGIGRK